MSELEKASLKNLENCLGWFVVSGNIFSFKLSGRLAVSRMKPDINKAKKQCLG